VVIGAAGDPVKAGIVSSLAKPGGNVTDVSSLALELEGKRLELLKELVPKVSRVGVFWHPDNPYSALATKEERGSPCLSPTSPAFLLAAFMARWW
jgi:ABC-type uncharacterized transport system substrate-binding protein